jgi:hypothetical protein
LTVRLVDAVLLKDSGKMSASAKVAAVLVALLATGGCVVYTSTNTGPRPAPRHAPRPPRAQPRPATPRPQPVSVPAPRPVDPPDAPPTARDRPLVLPDGIAAGRPAGFHPGAAPAYWIWQGPRGDWLLRTTTDGAHLFRGRIHPTGTDRIDDVRASRRELGDRVTKTDDGLVFSFQTSGHADGLTFSTQAGGCLRFDLQLDGGATPKRIFIGKAQHEPASSHFIVCPKGKSP